MSARFSGVAFSAAKESIDDLDWCKAPDAGLPAPDVVVFLEIPPEKAEARSGFGNGATRSRTCRSASRRTLTSW